MQATELVHMGKETPQRASSARWGRWSGWCWAGILLLGLGSFFALDLHRTYSWDDVRDTLDYWQVLARDERTFFLWCFLGVALVAEAMPGRLVGIVALAAGALAGRFLGTLVVGLGSASGEVLGSRLGYKKCAPFSWRGLLGRFGLSFLYVNAGAALGRIDSLPDFFSAGVVLSLILLVVGPRLLRLVLTRLARAPRRTRGIIVASLGLLLLAGIAGRTYLRYGIASVMEIPVKEFSNSAYPEDPAVRSIHYGKYNGRKLTLIRKDETHFDLLLERGNGLTARVAFRDIDVSLMTPGLPDWTKADPGLRRIALTDRQWNRQQVRFDRDSPHLEISGGNGFEMENLFTAELAKNCLNAGLWEILLFVKETGSKALYYHGWFTFPLGHYQHLFEHNTGFSYWNHWYYLEHWVDPSGTPIPLEGLRQVVAEHEVPVTFDPSESIVVSGEQLGKRRTLLGDNLVTWKDFFAERRIRFAQFIPPGRYSVLHPWKNEYWRLERLEKGILRQIVSPARKKPLHELELVFADRDHGKKCRFFVSGFDPSGLPQLSLPDYPRGMYMPMGIGVPPFFQSYQELKQSPPGQSPYFSVMLDERDRWLNHHEVAVDGPVLHRDAGDPKLLHVYLLSYERHSLIGHFVVSLKG